MKIYVKNLKINNINSQLNNVSQNLLKNTIKYREIFSPEGIFRIRNNDIFMLLPQDIPCEYVADTNLIIDRSSYILKKTNSIPYNHCIYDIEQTDYKFYSNSTVSLMIHRCNNIVIDIYFNTKDKEFNKNLKNDINEYLSLFNHN